MSSTPNSPNPTSPTPPGYNEEHQVLPEKVRTSSYIAATLAVLLTLEIAGIAIYGYYRVQQALKPENLADRVEETVRENYPEFRATLVTQAQENAPELAKQVSETVIAAVPDARVDLERMVARQLAIGLDNATELSAEQFRDLLKENRAQFVKVFNAIEDAPEEAHQLVLETEASIEKQLGVDLQRQAKLAVKNLDDLNAKLDRLAGSPDTLSAKEQVERRIVRVLRAMQQSESNMQISALPQPRR